MRCKEEKGNTTVCLFASHLVRRGLLSPATHQLAETAPSQANLLPSTGQRLTGRISIQENVGFSSAPEKWDANVTKRGRQSVNNKPSSRKQKQKGGVPSAESMAHVSSSLPTK
jgi:hypothetical protein